MVALIQYQTRTGNWITLRKTGNRGSDIKQAFHSAKRVYKKNRIRAVDEKGNILDIQESKMNIPDWKRESWKRSPAGKKAAEAAKKIAAREKERQRISKEVKEAVYRSDLPRDDVSNIKYDPKTADKFPDSKSTVSISRGKQSPMEKYKRKMKYRVERSKTAVPIVKRKKLDEISAFKAGMHNAQAAADLKTASDPNTIRKRQAGLKMSKKIIDRDRYKRGYNIPNPDEVKEEAPPSPKIEKWIKSNKARFKKEYGAKKGEEILYGKAWNMYREEQQLDELGDTKKGKEMLMRYAKKADKSVDKLDKKYVKHAALDDISRKPNYDKADKVDDKIYHRMQGIKRAHKKAGKKYKIPFPGRSAGSGIYEGSDNPYAGNPPAWGHHGYNNPNSNYKRKDAPPPKKARKLSDKEKQMFYPGTWRRPDDPRNKTNEDLNELSADKYLRFSNKLSTSASDMNVDHIDAVNHGDKKKAASIAKKRDRRARAANRANVKGIAKFLNSEEEKKVPAHMESYKTGKDHGKSGRIDFQRYEYDRHYRRGVDDYVPIKEGVEFAKLAKIAKIKSIKPEGKTMSKDKKTVKEGAKGLAVGPLHDGGHPPQENVYAKSLSDPKYRQRKVKNKKQYTRKEKHKGKAMSESTHKYWEGFLPEGRPAKDRESAEEPKFHTNLQKAAAHAAVNADVVHHYKHNDGSVTKIDKSMGAKIRDHINNAPNRHKADIVQKFHASAKNVKAALGEETEIEESSGLSTYTLRSYRTKSRRQQKEIKGLIAHKKATEVYKNKTSVPSIPRNVKTDVKSGNKYKQDSSTGHLKKITDPAERLLKKRQWGAKKAYAKERSKNELKQGAIKQGAENKKTNQIMNKLKDSSYKPRDHMKAAKAKSEKIMKRSGPKSFRG